LEIAAPLIAGYDHSITKSPFEVLTEVVTFKTLKGAPDATIVTVLEKGPKPHLFFARILN